MEYGGSKRKCVMEGKSKAKQDGNNKTYENNKKEQLFDSFAVLQSLLLINSRDEILYSITVWE